MKDKLGREVLPPGWRLRLLGELGLQLMMLVMLSGFPGRRGLQVAQALNKPLPVAARSEAGVWRKPESCSLLQAGS